MRRWIEMHMFNELCCDCADIFVNQGQKSASAHQHDGALNGFKQRYCPQRRRLSSGGNARLVERTFHGG